jgi:hypothetical protein
MSQRVAGPRLPPLTCWALQLAAFRAANLRAHLLHIHHLPPRETNYLANGFGVDRSGAQTANERINTVDSQKPTSVNSGTGQMHLDYASGGMRKCTMRSLPERSCDTSSTGVPWEQC